MPSSTADGARWPVPLRHLLDGTGGTAPTVSIRGSDANFYGGTRSGGLFNRGRIFRITPDVGAS